MITDGEGRSSSDRHERRERESNREGFRGDNENMIGPSKSAVRNSVQSRTEQSRAYKS